MKKSTIKFCKVKENTPKLPTVTLKLKGTVAVVGTESPTSKVNLRP